MSATSFTRVNARQGMESVLKYRETLIEDTTSVKIEDASDDTSEWPQAPYLVVSEGDEGHWTTYVKIALSGRSAKSQQNELLELLQPNKGDLYKGSIPLPCPARNRREDVVPPGYIIPDSRRMTHRGHRTVNPDYDLGNHWELSDATPSQSSVESLCRQASRPEALLTLGPNNSENGEVLYKKTDGYISPVGMPQAWCEPRREHYAHVFSSVRAAHLFPHPEMHHGPET
ncbi:hypothetical protein C8J57DRAFT_1354750 [Mycena rebaudengoi]|nr:hypothetical protein C8J57DRAFT_1354750 [Mycena rebaudengoi]